MSNAHDERRTHEVRLGMSIYWVSTWPADDGGFWWSRGNAVGSTPGTRLDAIIDASHVLRQREDEESAAFVLEAERLWEIQTALREELAGRDVAQACREAGAV